MSSNLKSLMSRLNPLARGTLEASAGLCLSRTNYEVEIEHWLLKLLDTTDSDIRRICHHFDVEMSLLTRDLTRTVDRFRTGNSRNPVLSPSLVELVEQGWMVASIEFASSQIRTGHLLLALLAGGGQLRRSREASSQLQYISEETLRSEFARLTAGSPEEGTEATAQTAARPAAAAGEPATGSALDRYTQDLAGQAKSGKVDPIVGRDPEIRQMVDILMRRRQNNPILTGEAGVGKTAVVEGLACRIVAGDVPPPLREVSIRALDLGLLQAGAGVKGEFENRLKAVIQEVKASPRPIILFIDEAHTLIGAGGTAGQGDAANLLKPALARGELRTIAATTWSEYKKYFEKDAALTRRFQVVKVDEPTEELAIRMLRGVVGRLEHHHRVRILTDAVEDAVRLSHRYLTGRQLPDKAVSVLDTAAARVAVSLCATPPALEDCQRRLEGIGIEWEMLTREEATGVDHGARRQELLREREEVHGRRETLEAQWKEELRLVEQLLAIQARLEVASRPTTGSVELPPPPPELAALQEEMQRLESELERVQGDAPLVHAWVDSSAVADVISGWTGIPVGGMLRDELDTVRSLQTVLAQRVIGQAHALEAIAQRIQTARAGMDDPGRPVGVFLLAGPSGVGKTETALALADILYGGERNLITINMSEYQEKHTVSTLKGAPPGYVGYGEGGVLTEAVRRRPYSVVLMDEVEKAHPDVLKLFFQVFDKGWMEDGEGREIDFKNTVIILTTNLGTDAVMEATHAGQTRPDPALLSQVVRMELQRRMPPALLGRLVIVPYYPLSDLEMGEIVRLKLDRIVKRARQEHGIRLSFTAEVVQEIVGRCTEVDTGARNVDHILTRTLLPEISRELLAALGEGRVVTAIHVATAEGGGFTYDLETAAC